MSGNRYLVQSPSPHQVINKQSVLGPAQHHSHSSYLHFTKTLACALVLSGCLLSHLNFYDILFITFSQHCLPLFLWGYNEQAFFLLPVSVSSKCVFCLFWSLPYYRLCHMSEDPWLSAYIRSEEMKCFQEALSTAGQGSQPRRCHCFGNKKTRKPRWSHPYKSAFQNI